MACMTKEHREALDKTLVCLTNDLAIEEALVYLQSEGIFTENDVEAVDLPTSTRIKKVTELVKRLKQKGESSYLPFKKFLEETQGCEHIAIELDKNLKEVEEKLADDTQERERMIVAEKWKKLEKKFYDPSFFCEHDSIHQYQGISKDINVLLIGKCGAGKSATGNTLLGNDIFEESDTDAPETKSVKFETIQEGTFNITVIDTPGIQNEELLLNVVEKMLDFERGIHLFLVVCKENADQEMTNVISRILAETACDQCVVILTNARARFVGRKKMIMRDYIERQKNREDPLADLFQIVQDRVIAVENCFDEEDVIMINQQRQQLLSYLAQVIKNTKGLVYSKISFQNAKTRIKQYKALNDMKGRLHEYLFQTYLKKLSQRQLDNIQTTLDDNVKEIMKDSNVLELCPLITEGDAMQYMRLLIKENESELSKLKKELDQEMQADEERHSKRWKHFEEHFYCSSCEYENIGDYHDVPEEINILLIGKTGSGKSATGNTIIGKPCFIESGTSQSMTKTIETKTMKERGFNITVIDTPGLFDTTKDFRNEDLVLEIAKMMIKFERGIHLFLLVLSATSKFTLEEQDTINAIEKILGKNVYQHCLIVLTYADAKFGAMDKQSLQQYVTKENKDRSKFADLLKLVSNRIIAVENCFEDEFLSEKHRQKLLCCLAQLIHDNKGSVYSNKSFRNAKVRVERQEKERKKRVTRKSELTHMKSTVRKFLVQQYLKELTKEQLDDVHMKVSNETAHIMTKSGVNQLEFITGADVDSYVKSFIQENEVLIAKLKDLKIQEAKQQLEYEKRKKQLKEKEMINKMQRIVLPLVSKYLRQQSKQALEQINQNKQLTYDCRKQITAALESSNVNVDIQHTEKFIQATFFENPTQIQEYIEEKVLTESLEEKSKQLQQVQREQKLNEIMRTLISEISKALEGKNDEELSYFNLSVLDNLKPLLTELVGNNIEGSDINTIEVTNLFLEQNNKWVESIFQIQSEKKQKQMQANLLQEREKMRNDAFSKISTEINDNLKSYLEGKRKSELKELENQIGQDEVPSGIFDEVYNKLTSEQQQSISRDEVEAEILKQIKEHKKVIEKCKKVARECFAGCAEVRIKERGIAKISNVKIDDEILVFDDNGYLFYDKVYLISHAREDENITFVRLQTSSNKDLRISPGHLLPVGSLGSNVAAKEVSLGNVIFTLQDGVMMPDKVTSVTYELCRGAYCPMTMHGTIVVKDVAASCYTTFFPSPLAHALLSPIRLLFSYLPLPLFNRLLPYDTEEGMPVLLLKCRSIIIRLRSWCTRNGNPNKACRC